MAEPIQSRRCVQGIVPARLPEQSRYSLTRLNAFENPYPPPAEVVEEMLQISERRMRLYPDPQCAELRQAIATSFRLKSRQVACTNGSDEALRLILQAFADPGDRVAYLWPTYSHWETLVQASGAEPVRLPWMALSQEAAIGAVPPGTRILYLASPNPPIGLPVDSRRIEEFAAHNPGTLVVVDEAFVAFSGATALRLVRAGMRNVVVTRSFSKSHSLGGFRVGFAIGHEEIIAPLLAIRDPHSVNAFGQAMALVAWRCADWLAETVGRITMTRSRVRMELLARGYDVPPGAGNFLFVQGGDAGKIISALRERNILVHYDDSPELESGFVATIGTDDEMDIFLGAMDALLDYSPSRSGVFKLPSKDMLG